MSPTLIVATALFLACPPLAVPLAAEVATAIIVSALLSS